VTQPLLIIIRAGPRLGAGGGAVHARGRTRHLLATGSGAADQPTPGRPGPQKVALLAPNQSLSVELRQDGIH
jgi:hypothetical protein